MSEAAERTGPGINIPANFEGKVVSAYNNPGWNFDLTNLDVFTNLALRSITSSLIAKQKWQLEAFRIDYQKISHGSELEVTTLALNSANPVTRLHRFPDLPDNKVPDSLSNVFYLQKIVDLRQTIVRNFKPHLGLISGKGEDSQTWHVQIASLRRKIGSNLATICYQPFLLLAAEDTNLAIATDPNRILVEVARSKPKL